jgi:hypothetical protein
MVSSGKRNQLIFIAVIVVVVGFIGVQMFYSLTPPRHADHDHAMASLDAGGFLRIQAFDGGRRNLVGKPGRVLIMHFFDPKAVNSSEQAQASRFAASLSDDRAVDVLFVARADSWDGIAEWAQRVGVNTAHLYLDPEGRTSDLLGVQRWPETLIYDPKGLLVRQAKGSMDWSSPDLRAEIQRAKAGVEEIH